jgi:hypothetical protein
VARVADQRRPQTHWCVYVLLVLVLLLCGFIDAIMMRSPLAIAASGHKATCRRIIMIGFSLPTARS